MKLHVPLEAKHRLFGLLTWTVLILKCWVVLFNHFHTPGEEFNMIEDSQHGTNYYHALAPRLAAKVEKKFADN